MTFAYRNAKTRLSSYSQELMAFQGVADASLHRMHHHGLKYIRLTYTDRLEYHVVFPNSFQVAPRVNRPRTSRSRETDGSPASMRASRLWLVLRSEAALV